MNKRVALAIEEDGKEIKIAGHFGHCSKFLVIELDENNVEVKHESYFNPLAGQHSGSCQVPGYVKQFNVETIIAGGMGQKAVNGFHSFGIEVITASGLLYEEAIDLFKKGEISGFEVCAHSQEHGHHHDHNHDHHHDHHHHHNNN